MSRFAATLGVSVIVALSATSIGAKATSTFDSTVQPFLD